VATIYEVSKRAGVSLATVSRVLNNSSKVRPATKEKVQAAMAELGYKPNAIAQSLASKRSNTIGVLMSELDGPFYGPMMMHIESTFRAHNKHVIFAAGHSDAQAEQDGVQFLLGRQVDGLILHVEAVDDAYLESLANSGVPVTVIGRHVESDHVCSIDLDNERGGYFATKAALDAGHRKIAYISGPLRKTDAKKRLNGHKRALSEVGLEFSDQDLYEGTYKVESGYDAARGILASDQDYTVIISANDEMASGVLLLMREQGIVVPKEMSVIGFDNIAYARFMYPSLTTVNYPIGEMAEMAAKWLASKVYLNEEIELKEIIEPSIVLRESLLNR